MTEQIFWRIVDESAHESRHDLERFILILEEKLSQLEAEDILKFDAILHENMRAGFKSGLMAAAYVINAGCDEEGLERFLGWLIAQGSEIWNNAMKNPDTLADIELPELAELIQIWNVPAIAYENATNNEDFEIMREDYQPLKLIGDTALWQNKQGEADEEKIKKLIPKLYQLYFE